MNIQTKYKEVENKEKQGIELYFEAIPTAEERTELKANGYKWNNAKKCWYIKQGKAQEQEPIALGVREMKNSYTGYGWEGVNSSKNLTMVEIAKIIKKELKRVFPSASFSVTTEGNAYYSGLNVYLMKDSKDPFNDYETAVKEACKSSSSRIYENYDNWVGLSEQDIRESEERKKNIKNRLESGHIQLNHYHIDSDYELSEYGKKLFGYVVELCNSFNFDDSDGMIDYFHCKFYLSIAIGKWDKKFELLEN